MIALSGIFTTAVLSPLPFVLCIAVGIALALKRRTKPAAWVLSCTAALLLLLSTGVVRDLLLRPLEYRAPAFPADAPSVDAIVALGGGVVDGTPEEGGAALSPAAFKRAVYAAMLQSRLGVPVIVSGGTTWRSAGGVREADVAAALLARLGVPRDRIVTEGRSRTTWENAREVAALLAGRGAKRVALVTSAVHMPRALMAFSRAGIVCVAAPTDYLSGRRRWGLADFLPAFGPLKDCFVGLQEYFGIALYAIRG